MAKSKGIAGSIILLCAYLGALSFLTSCRQTVQLTPVNTEVFPSFESSSRGNNADQSNSQSPIFLLMSQTGIYQFCPEDYGITSDMEPQRLQLTDRNKPVQTWLHTVDDRACIRFFVEAQDNRYAKQSVFRLSLVNQPAAEIEQLVLLPTVEPTSRFQRVRITQQFEENLIYDPQFDHEMPWLWTRVPFDQTASVEIETQSDELKAAHIKLSFWAKSASPVMEAGGQAEHRVFVTINSEEPELVHWNGSGEFTITISKPGLLLATKNKLRIGMSLDLPAGTIGDTVFLDKLAISGEPNPIAVSGKYSGGSLPLPPDQTEDPIQALAIDRGTPTRLFDFERGSTEMYILPDHDDLSYYLFRDQDVLKPEMMSKSGSRIDLRDPGLMGDYLIIGAQQFESTLSTLLETRRDEGMLPIFIDLQSIYNQFGTGYPEPEAIREFLHFAVEHWAVPPSYVLLVGDNTHQVNDLFSGEAKWNLPSSYIYTTLGGWTLSDADLVDFNRDGKPDLAVGRIPVRDNHSLEVVLEKIIGYQAQRINSDQNLDVEVLAESDEPAFAALTAELSAEMPASMLLPGVTDYPANIKRERLINYLERPDPALLIYIGHGSLTQLAATDLLNTQDFSQLKHERSYGMMAMFTCLAGYFAHPTAESIGEMLIEHPESAMAAVIVPSSLTLPDRQNSLLARFSTALANETNQRIGDVLLETQQISLDMDDIDLDIVRTWLLLGDPAMRIRP
ncbi:MAG: C25 family cysteine peptidase [Anaerolineales bacterium]